MPKLKVVICPYCGETQPATDRCRVCLGLFEPLSRQATHNAMGPWFIRNPGNPYQPGCSYETLVKMVDRGQLNRYTIVRGPTTRQFWTVARHTPGVAHLLGYCHNCDTAVNKKDLGCPQCGAPFGAYLERNYLGLPEIKPLPWEAETPDATDHWGAHFGTPRPQATGLSSFGTDEELSAGGGRFAQTTSTMLPALNGGGSAPALAPVVPTPGPGLSAALDADQTQLAARQRALERRIAQQRRTILWLVIAVGAALILVLLFALDVFGLGAGESPSDGTRSPAEVRESAEQANENPVTTSDDNSAPEANGESAPPDDPEAVSPPSGEPGVDQSGGPSDEEMDQPLLDPDDPFVMEYARAEQLIAQSRNEEIDLDERMRLLTEAIAILKQIDVAAPPESRPANLAERIAAEEKELRRLNLKRELG